MTDLEKLIIRQAFEDLMWIEENTTPFGPGPHPLKKVANPNAIQCGSDTAPGWLDRMSNSANRCE